MQLHQIQVQYDALEDRALLRVSTRESAESLAEFRFWLTRRFAAMLLSALAGNVVSAAQARVETPPESRPELIAFERESALAESDFETAYTHEEKAMPLGETPVLLARVGVSRVEPGVTTLALHPHSGKGIEVRLNDTLVHSLIKLVEDAARSGGWNLPQALPLAATPAGEQRLN